MAEGEGGGGKETRGYRVFKAAVYDPENASAFADAIKEILGEEHTDRVDVLVICGHAVQAHPNKALEVVAGVKRLNGDFEIAADSAFTTYPVEVETEPRVKVGAAKK